MGRPKRKPDELNPNGSPLGDNPDGNDGTNSPVLKAILKRFDDFDQRFEELERTKDPAGEAQLLVAKRTYDTDREHLPEMTVITPRMVNPLSLSDCCAAILDADIQDGVVTLGQIRRESMYRHLRSVRGNLLDKAAQHALQQEQLKGEEAVKPWEVGKGT